MSGPEPTTRRLVEEVAAALRDRIAPAVTEVWAASELRSIDAVLAVVSARLDHDASVTAEDNAELEALLSDLAGAGLAVPSISHPADPDALNVAMRAALEVVLEQVHDGRHPAELAAVRRYLVAATGRDQRLYGPLVGRRAF